VEALGRGAAAGWFCLYSVVVWVVTSRYPRYLMASFPLLAPTAAIGWQVLFGWAAAGVRRLFGAREPQGADVGVATGAMSRDTARGGARVADWIPVLLLAVLAAVSVRQTAVKVEMISITPEAREALLRQHVPGYAAMDYLRRNATGRVYQIALNEAIYYGPNPIWGDTLGPWRYTDFGALSGGDLARKLGGLGFTARRVCRTRWCRCSARGPTSTSTSPSSTRRTAAGSTVSFPPHHDRHRSLPIPGPRQQRRLAHCRGHSLLQRGAGHRPGGGGLQGRAARGRDPRLRQQLQRRHGGRGPRGRRRRHARGRCAARATWCGACSPTSRPTCT
jgi:hypothetical protein